MNSKQPGDLKRKAFDMTDADRKDEELRKYQCKYM